MSGRVRFLKSQGPALVALFVALGGTAYAAGFPANVVGTKQLKANAVTQPKVASNAVNGTKIANDSLAGADLRQGSLAMVASAAHADTAAQTPAAAVASTVPNVPSASNAALAADSPLLGGLGPTVYEKRMTKTCNHGFSELGGSLGGFCGGASGGFATTINSGGVLLTSDPPNITNVVVSCHASGEVSVEIKNITEVAGTLNWLFSDGTTVNASGTVIAPHAAGPEFSFLGKRIEGQFIAAAGAKVATIKIHVLDFGGACEAQLTAVGVG